MSKTFVMIHGSWHGGWAWQSVARQLASKGHRAYAPTLPGHEPGASRVGITHQDYVDAVITYLKQHNLNEVVMVGHSFGGSVISRVAQYLPKQIKQLVFLDAFVLANGESVYDNLPGEFKTLLNQLAQDSPDNSTVVPWEIWRDHFIQDASEEVARLLWGHLTPEPNRPNIEKLDLRAFERLDIPRSFISCRQDVALPPGSFHPQMSSRLGKCKVVEMDGSHEVLFTRPAEVADKLIHA